MVENTFFDKILNSYGQKRVLIRYQFCQIDNGQKWPVLW